MAIPSFTLLMFVSLLCHALSDQDLNLNEHPQDSNIDPTVQDASKESHRLSPTDKRTIFSNLLNHNNFALARHFVYRNGVKYLLGYGQVDLRYTPHFKSVYIRPRLPLPWTYAGVSNKPVSVIHQQLPKTILPTVSHHNAWQDTPIVPPILTSRPVAIHIPATTPQEGAYHPISLVHMQPVKINLPVLPFGAMFLTPVLPKHQQQHLEYYPLPIPQPLADQHVHVHNPHPHVQELQPTVAVVPGSSYEVHGYQPHQHISFVPSTVAIAQGTSVHQEEAAPELQQYHTSEDQVPQDQPYVSSLEFHGKHSYQNHAIQPGHTDVQIPLHLTQHPTYHPEDYYNYLREPSQEYYATQRSDVVQRNVSKAPFKPSERIYSYK